MDRILVAIDGSEFANKGLDEALKLAKKFNSKVFLIYVGESVGFEEEGAAEAYRNAVEKYATQVLSQAKQRLAKEGVETEEIFCWGRPADEIIIHASDVGAKLIVVGSRGRAVSKLKRFLMGSVSKEVAEKADCSVLVVR